MASAVLPRDTAPPAPHPAPPLEVPHAGVMPFGEPALDPGRVPAQGSGPGDADRGESDPVLDLGDLVQ